MTLSHALQARIAANLSENKNNYYEDAMKYLNECLVIAENIFGLISFKVAQVHRLQSATYLSNQM
jgi:phosphotransferase system HPr-like phosphotransfer protein